MSDGAGAVLLASAQALKDYGAQIGDRKYEPAAEILRVRMGESARKRIICVYRRIALAIFFLFGLKVVENTAQGS